MRMNRSEEKERMANEAWCTCDVQRACLHCLLLRIHLGWHDIPLLRACDR